MVDVLSWRLYPLYALIKFLCRHPQKDKVAIRVFDMDSLSSDEALGETEVSLEQFRDGNEHDVDLQLSDLQSPASLQLKLRYLSFSGKPITLIQHQCYRHASLRHVMTVNASVRAPLEAQLSQNADSARSCLRPR